MDASAAGAGGASGGRKRKSRFSDAVERPHAPVAAAAPPPPLDPVAVAKAAAEKIARAIPGTAMMAQAPPVVAPAATVSASALDVAEQQRAAAEKRRRTEQIYASVQQQMSHIQALLRKPGASSAGATTFMPAPLLLDEHGRQVDASGRVIEETLPAPVATVKANQMRASGASSAATAPPKQNQNLNPYLSHRSVDKEDAVDAVDPRLSIRKRETYVLTVCTPSRCGGCDTGSGDDPTHMKASVSNLSCLW